MPLNPFHKEKTLDELQEEDDRLSQEVSVEKKRQELQRIKMAMKQVDERGGKGMWKKFSSNGKTSGLSLGSMVSWLRNH